MIDSVVLVSDVPRSDSVRREPASIPFQAVSHGGHHRKLSRAPCAVGLVVYCKDSSVCASV